MAGVPAAIIGQNSPCGGPLCACVVSACLHTLIPVPKNQEIVMSYTYREAALNWLALGLLLAAWNATDDTVPAAANPPERPDALRGHPHVSVRSATQAAVVQRGFTGLARFGYE